MMMVKKMIMTVKKRKQSHTDQILLISIDLCEANYQILLITYQEFTIRNANHAWKEKKLRSECEFVEFKNDRLKYICKE